MSNGKFRFEDERSKKAFASDKLQEQLANQRQTVFRITFWLVVLIEIGLWYFQIDLWIRLVVPMLWIGLLIHNNALLILHELWEINDQLAGRKDEFRNVISSEQHAGVTQLRLESTVTGQSGMLVHGTMADCNNLYVNNFDNRMLQLGDNAAGKACFWSNFSEIRLRVDNAVNATTGVFVDTSNDNTFTNVVVSGNCVNSLLINGTGNKWNNGT